MTNITRRSVLKTAGMAVAAAPVLAAARPAAAESTSTSLDRADAVRIINEARKIVNPGGISRLETVKIGGIEQFVSIRGRSPKNPALLFLHGGPGYVSIPMSWWFSHPWEEYFTVVQWDQRGSGKTYLINDPAVVGPTMTFERMVHDTEEMTKWVLGELNKEKIFVVAHSWGTYLGLQMAKHHPELLHAYVGVAQITNSPESERRGWKHTMDAARRAGNSKAIRELESISPYFAFGHDAPLKNIYTQRRWLDYYGGVMAFRHGNSAESDLTKLSPDYTRDELLRIWEGNRFSEFYLLAKLLSLDLSGIRDIRCPLIVFAGREDVNVNSYVAEEWFSTVTAPSKQFVWFENAAHLLMTEKPGQFLMSLVSDALPIARRAGDAPKVSS